MSFSVPILLLFKKWFCYEKNIITNRNKSKIIALEERSLNLKDAFHRKKNDFHRKIKIIFYNCDPKQKILNSNKFYLLMHPIHTPLKMCIALFAITCLFSCSKDADLLSDYVIAKDNDLQSIALLIDDSFYMAPGQENIVMDVLNNDSFESNAEVAIVSTSNPNNGDVVINSDNTLTYTPQTNSQTQESQEPVEDDSFTYTTEVTTEDNTTYREEATVTVTSSEMGELKAFPSAEGFGKYTTGGRGGKVVHVTNLNDSGPGSFRSAVESTGKRTVVFDVGGKIALNTTIVIHEDYGDLTIAGETAPFPGIELRDYGIEIRASNVIIKYITVRLGGQSFLDSGVEQDCITIRNFGGQGTTLSNIIIDHCSVSWATDENLSISTVNSASKTEDITVQNCIIGEAASGSGYNMLLGQNLYNISIFQNYFSHSRDRSPLIGYGLKNETIEVINNIVYGYEAGGIIAFGNNVDFIGNIYKAFLHNKPDQNTIDYGANKTNNPNALESDGSLFVADNFQLNPIDYSLYGGKVTSFAKSSRVINNSKIVTWEKSVSQIENKVFSNAGNDIFRDDVDKRLINNYFTNSGDFFNSLNPATLIGGWTNKSISTRPTNYDTDNDGMSDDWERLVFGDLSKTATDDEDNNGYTNIETFFFYLSQN